MTLKDPEALLSLSNENQALLGKSDSSHPSEELPLYTSHVPKQGALNKWKTRLIMLAVAVILVVFLQNTRRFTRHSPSLTQNPAYLITAKHGAVASENERCSRIGVDVMKDGGNAVEATISAALCIGVVNMFSSGIGGGGFMTVRIPPREPGGASEVFSVDFREIAPALAHKHMYSDNATAAMYGGLSVAVPGELRGLAEAYKRWGGSLTWERLVRPSVDLAEQWTVDVELAKRIQRYSRLMLEHDDWKPIFAPDGKLLLQGETIRRTNYSRTLAIIASEGPEAFYKGPIADAIVRKVQETGGILTHADLEGYRVKVERALQGTYHDRKVYTTYAPTSGPALLHMLNLIERYNLVEEGRTGLNLHRLVESEKFGFAARTRLGDPAYLPNDTVHIAEIPTKEYADKIAVNLTDDRTHPMEYYNPDFDIKTDHGTTHISTVDKDGMAVALTTTINLIFGSQVLDPETGIILNDEMDDFSIPGIPNAFGLWPSPYNYPEPGKRPLSSMTPTIMEYNNGSFYLAVGGSGGSLILTSVFQVILNLDWGLDASQAIEYGRVHDQLLPRQVDADEIIPNDLLDALRVRGHNVTVQDMGRIAAAVQDVLQKDGLIYAASDSRKNGIAAGY
ncbi:gamma-glutamyltranspeptidase [Scleroderma yunnanense]